VKVACGTHASLERPGEVALKPRRPGTSASAPESAAQSHHRQAARTADRENAQQTILD
jgi:hypothetical protein